MIYPYGSLKGPAPFPNAQVDRLEGQTGAVDEFARLDIDISDEQLVQNLDQRIDDSKNYWDEIAGFNLSTIRSDNMRMYLGLQVDERDFYQYETPYVENQISVIVESIVSYCTARTPQSEVTPGDDNDRTRKFASDLEKIHSAHSLKFDLRGIIEVCIRNWCLKRAAYIYLEFDPTYGKNGEIIPRAIDPEHLVVDKNAGRGANPGFIALFEKYSVEQLLFLFPEKRQDILDSLGIKRRGKRNMTNEVIVRKVWFTYFSKDSSKEGYAIYFNNVLLASFDDLNWLEGRPNFLDAPQKPFIPLNIINDGNHWIDFTTPVEQAMKMQTLLNRRGHQIMTNADKSNGIKVIDLKGSGLKKEDAENLTGGPNQVIALTNKNPNVKLVGGVIDILPGQPLQNYVVNDKIDMRNQIGNIGGAPTDFTGSDSTGDDEALGQSILKKNSAAGRQDAIVRAIDTFLYKYFNFLTQMEFVWYDEAHYFTYNDSDGDFDRLTIKRDYFSEGMAVSIKAGGTIAFDKNRRQAVVLQLLKNDQIAYIDAYRELGFENPQKLYDNWVKQKTDPTTLAREVNESYDNGKAYVEFVEFMGGAKPKMHDDTEKDYILTLRKLMLTEKFLKAKPKYQEAFLKRVKEYVESLELRTSLDEMSQQGPQMLDPSVPIQPFQPPQQNMLPPGSPPPNQMVPPNAQPTQPPQGSLGGSQPSLGSVFNGTPIPNPANPQIPSPGAVSALPQV